MDTQARLVPVCFTSSNTVLKQYDIVDSGNVLNHTARAMKLTRGRLLKQDDWEELKQSEYLQLDQYEEQGMFGAPIDPKTDDPIFYLVWTYTVKQVVNRKKARCVCDGSTRSGQVQVLDETYANCVDHTSARLFYAVASSPVQHSEQRGSKCLPF